MRPVLSLRRSSLTQTECLTASPLPGGSLPSLTLTLTLTRWEPTILEGRDDGKPFVAQCVAARHAGLSMLVLGLGPGCEGMYLTAELQVTCPTRSGSISASAFSPPTGYGPAPCAETLTCNMHMQHAHATCTCNMHIHGPMQATQEGAPPPYCWQSRVLGCDALKAGVPAHEEARLLRRCVAFPEAALEFCRDAQGDVKIVLTIKDDDDDDSEVGEMFDEMFEIVYEGDEHDALGEEGEGEGEEVMMLAGPPMAFGPPLRSPGHVLPGGRLLPMPPPVPLPMLGLGRAALPSAVLGRGRGGGAGRTRRGGDFVAAARRYPDVARLRAAVEAAEVEEREEEAAFVRRVRAWRNASLGSEVWRNAGLAEAREMRERREALEADGMRCEMASDDEEQQAEEAGEGLALTGAPSSSAAASASREQLRGQRPASPGWRGQWAGRLRRQ